MKTNNEILIDDDNDEIKDDKLNKKWSLINKNVLNDDNYENENKKIKKKAYTILHILKIIIIYETTNISEWENDNKYLLRRGRDSLFFTNKFLNLIRKIKLIKKKRFNKKINYNCRK